MKTEELKQSFLESAELRREFFSLPVKSELGMSSFDLPRECLLSVLSPAHSTKAIYFSVGITLAPKAYLHMLGRFEVVSVEGVMPLPVQAVELLGRDGVGLADTPVASFSSPLHNEANTAVRLALRLARADELPDKFLLFLPEFESAGQHKVPAPLLFCRVAGRGLCIFGGVVQPSVPPSAQAVAPGGPGCG